MKTCTASLIAVSILLAVCMGTPAHAQGRIALVVGNNAYENVTKLERAVNDSTAVAGSLRAMGFEVLLATDVSRRALVQRLAEFNSRIRDGDLALFYYAGHGIEIRGANYILPVDVPAVRDGQETLVTAEAVPTEKIISGIQDRGARTVVMILDACRDNPFRRSATRGVGGVRGLAMASPPEGVFVLYSAGVGQAALDRLSNTDSDPNSVFTRVLLKEIAHRKATMIDIAKATQVQVRSIAIQADHAQVPAYYDQVVGQLRLASGETPRTVPAPAGPPPSQGPPQTKPGPAVRPAIDPPVGQGRAATPALKNKGFENYLARVSRSISVRDTFMSGPVELCDQLASAGSDDPDSRAPRVPYEKINVGRASKACVAAILQEPRTIRLRTQLARALLWSASRSDKADGFAILLDLAKDGSAVAMWRIAIAYSTGNGVKEDMTRAIAWFRNAADKGLGAAMSDLGAYLRLGEGVAKDPAEAARLFERAAAVGHAGGMRNYAFVLDRGAGVQFNPTRAADCLLTAYRMGSAAAEDSLFTKHESWRVETKKEVQKLLRDYGFYNGEIDGTFRESSFAALRALAAANPVPQKD
jgi:hypothetical protein